MLPSTWLERLTTRARLAGGVAVVAQPPLQEYEASARALLDESERRRADELAEATSIREYVLCHALKRSLLAAWLGVSARALRFRADSRGKLHLSESSSVTFSLSHTRGMVACAVAPRSVGVDLERWSRSIPLPVIGRFVSEHLAQELSGLPHQVAQRQAVQAWTLHEARCKALGLGLGLRHPHQHYDVNFRTRLVDLKTHALAIASPALEHDLFVCEDTVSLSPYGSVS